MQFRVLTGCYRTNADALTGRLAADHLPRLETPCKSKGFAEAGDWSAVIIGLQSNRDNSLHTRPFRSMCTLTLGKKAERALNF